VSPYTTFLDGQNPSQFRGLAWLSLTGTGHVVRGSFVSDSGGGGSATFTPQGTVSCRIDPLAVGGAERYAGGQIDDRTTHLLRIPPDTDVTTADRFIIDGRGTFEVTALRSRTNEWLRTVEVVER